MSPRIASAVETALVSVAWVLLVVGVAVVMLTLPVYTTLSIRALGVSDTAGLSGGDTEELALKVRSFVADQAPEPLSRTYRGAPAFDAAAVSHLQDVRRVLAGARIATGVIAALLAGWVALCVARRRWERLVAGMRTGGLVTAGLVLLAGAAALLDFASFFSGLHGLFFKAGTWTFSADSLLIRLFPERFWASAGAVWGGLVACESAILLVVARSIPLAARRLASSRDAQNV